MGYSYDGAIKNFWPDDTDTELYVADNASLADIIDLAHEKWGPVVSYSDLMITPEKIHTQCLTYDLYDPSDYTPFLLITYNVK